MTSKNLRPKLPAHDIRDHGEGWLLARRDRDRREVRRDLRVKGLACVIERLLDLLHLRGPCNLESTQLSRRSDVGRPDDPRVSVLHLTVTELDPLIIRNVPQIAFEHTRYVRIIYNCAEPFRKSGNGNALTQMASCIYAGLQISPQVHVPPFWKGGLRCYAEGVFALPMVIAIQALVVALVAIMAIAL